MGRTVLGKATIVNQNPMVEFLERNVLKVIEFVLYCIMYRSLMHGKINYVLQGDQHMIDA